MIGADTRTYLLTQSSVTSLLSSTTAIYPIFLPQSHAGFPAMTYSQDADDDFHLLEGVSTLYEALVSLDIYSYGYEINREIADAVRAALVGFSGTFGSVTAQHVRCSRDIDLYESDTRLHHTSLQFLIAYS